MGLKGSGAVCALIYYKGLLYSGYSDGSIKVRKYVMYFKYEDHCLGYGCFLIKKLPRDILLKLANIKQHSLETGSLLPQRVGNQNERYLMYSIKSK